MNICNAAFELSDIGNKCALIQGYEQCGIIFNRRDIDFANCTFDDSKMTITKLAVKDGKTGYAVKQLKQAFSGTTVALNEGDYKNTFTNTVSFNIFNTGQEVSPVVRALANGEFIIFAKEKDSKMWRVFGFDAGLTATGIDNDAYNEGNPGWSITMTEVTDNPGVYFKQMLDDEDVSNETLASFAPGAADYIV